MQAETLLAIPVGDLPANLEVDHLASLGEVLLANQEEALPANQLVGLLELVVCVPLEGGLIADRQQYRPLCSLSHKDDLAEEYGNGQTDQAVSAQAPPWEDHQAFLSRHLLA